MCEIADNIIKARKARREVRKIWRRLLGDDWDPPGDITDESDDLLLRVRLARGRADVLAENRRQRGVELEAELQVALAEECHKEMLAETSRSKLARSEYRRCPVCHAAVGREYTGLHTGKGVVTILLCLWFPPPLNLIGCGIGLAALFTPSSRISCTKCAWDETVRSHHGSSEKSDD